MDRVQVGFVLAALYNASIIRSSRGFGDHLGAVDPLFSSGGCVVVVLWGAAYLAMAQRYQAVPAISVVFCVEKAFYGVHWLQWTAAHREELSILRAADPATASFFSSYGIGDLVFMVFFGWVAWRWRHNLRGPITPRETPEEASP